MKVLIESGFNGKYVWLKDVGIQRFRRDGKSISEEQMETLLQANAVLKGPLETPKTDAGDYRSLTVELRKNLELFANLRPFKQPGMDTLVIRENTEDLYVSRERLTELGAVAEKEITRHASLRIHNFAFDFAVKHERRRLTCVHKSNVLPLTDGLFLKTFWQVASKFKQLTADEVTVDTCAYKLQKNPSEFDILVTPNMYGDILSDQLAGALGSLGLCASMNFGTKHALFEPIHGTAPDITGTGKANPIGAIVAASMMARHLGNSSAADNIEKAVQITLSQGTYLTPDLGGNATCSQLTGRILGNVKHVSSS